MSAAPGFVLKLSLALACAPPPLPGGCRGSVQLPPHLGKERHLSLTACGAGRPASAPRTVLGDQEPCGDGGVPGGSQETLPRDTCALRFMKEAGSRRNTTKPGPNGAVPPERAPLVGAHSPSCEPHLCPQSAVGGDPGAEPPTCRGGGGGALVPSPHTPRPGLFAGSSPTAETPGEPGCRRSRFYCGYGQNLFALE